MTQRALFALRFAERLLCGRAFATNDGAPGESWLFMMIWAA